MEHNINRPMNGLQRLLWRLLRAAGSGRPDVSNDALPDRDSELQDALDNLTEAFALYDADDCLVVCNAAYRDLHAHMPDLVIPGVPFERIVTTAAMTGFVDLPVAARAAWIAQRLEFRRNAQKTMERTFRLRDGRWLHVVDHRTGSGGYISIIRDVTELKERERDLDEAWHATELANHAKFEFLANMSHELRTPLNAIMGFAEMLHNEVRGPLGNAAYVDYSRAIHESAIHLRDSIGDILELSRFEAGSVVLKEENVRIADLFETARVALDPHARPAGVGIHCDIEPRLPPLWADARMVRQILVNLLSNAVKFSTPGGEIVLRAQIGSNGGIEIAVSDRGIGIEAEHITKIMEPFEQVENSMTRAHRGVGLGLPLARMFCDAHDASLSIESMAGVGTSVIVTFPRDRICELCAVGE